MKNPESKSLRILVVDLWLRCWQEKNVAGLIRCHQQVCERLVSRRRVPSVSSFSVYQTVAVSLTLQGCWTSVPNLFVNNCDKVRYALFLPFPLSVDGALEMCLIYARSVRWTIRIMDIHVNTLSCLVVESAVLSWGILRAKSRLMDWFWQPSNIGLVSLYAQMTGVQTQIHTSLDLHLYCHVRAVHAALLMSA